MATRNRSGEDPLASLERLADAPEHHHIFHAFRLLEAAFPDAPRIGEARRPRDDMVRHGQEAELQFPPSTLAEFVPPKNNKPGRLTNRFFGLFGPNGPLPLHLTEYARERMRNHRDPTLVRFADMLTHRLTTLFYRAWRSGQPAASFDRGENDGIERKVAAIAGYHGSELRTKDHLPDLAKRHFAGLLAQGPKNAEGLKSMIQAFFGTRVEVEEFVGCWLELEPGDRWQMGGPAMLGRTASIGERVWTRSAKFRLRIGPLGYSDYERLLPGGGSLDRLRAIVRNYVGDALDWDVNLVLRGDERPEPKLGETVRLGQTGWIGQIDTTKDADDLFLEPNAQTQAAPITGGT
ncbi:MAG: type VI secretion system baseplate subunit TssG [Pseudomonadota bacterium]